MRIVINEISGEGETVQIEFIEDTPIPFVQADGFEFEELVGNVLYLSLYKEYIRDDGKIVRDILIRLSTTVDVFLKLVKIIDEAKSRTEPKE